MVKEIGTETTRDGREPYLVCSFGNKRSGMTSVVCPGRFRGLEQLKSMIVFATNRQLSRPQRTITILVPYPASRHLILHITGVFSCFRFTSVVGLSHSRSDADSSSSTNSRRLFDFSAS